MSDTINQKIITVKPTVQFALILLKASLKDIKSLGVTLGLPLFMFLTFWLSSFGDSPDGDFNIMDLMFPAIVSMAVMMAGLTQTIQLARWRQDGIFKRLALTPVPLFNLVVGAALNQIIIGILQGIVILLFGIIVVTIKVNLTVSLLTILVMFLAACAYITFGSLIACLTKKPEIAIFLFFFIFMPLFFIGSFPQEMLPEALGAIIPWLPTTMTISMLDSLLAHGELPPNALFSTLGLVVYTGINIIISKRFFRW